MQGSHQAVAYQQAETVSNTELDKKELEKKDPLYVVVHSTNSWENLTDTKWTYTKIGSRDGNDKASHTPRDCRKINYSHTDALLVEQSGSPTGPKMVWKIKIRKLAWVFYGG